MTKRPIPPQFVFTDVAAANAEVARLYRAVAHSGAAILAMIEIMPDDLIPAAARINDDLCDRLDALTDERDAEAAAKEASR